MSRAGTRRTFLVGLGRFMMGATAVALTKPPVLYSFPSEIRIATSAEQWFYAGNRAFAAMEATGQYEIIYDEGLLRVYAGRLWRGTK